MQSHLAVSRIGALTGVRFFAALTVMLYHWSGFVTVPLISLLVSHGYAAVDLFFVLSGFVLFYSYHGWFEGRVDRKRFWIFMQARIARVYPMHVLSLVLITPIGLYLLGHAEGDAHLSPIRSVFSWLANLLLLQVYLPIKSVQYVWNSPSWSVGDELFFYTIFPAFVALILSRLRTAKSLVVLSSMLFLLQLVFFVSGLFVVAHWPGTRAQGLFSILLYQSPIFRLWEFLLGCTAGAIFRLGQREASEALAWLFTSRRARNRVLIGTAIGLLALNAAPGGYSPFYAPLFAMLILALAAGPTVLSTVLEQPIVLLLGEASYSLYMLHWVILTHVLAAYGTMPGGWVGVLVSEAVMAATIGASVLCFRSIETPLRRVLRARTAPTGTAAPDMIGGTVLAPSTSGRFRHV